MSARPPGPVFLERRGYRQRRLIDALRLLPLLGLILLAVPMLWSQEAEGGVPASRAIIYIFGTWAGLTVATSIIVRKLTDQAVEGFDAGLPAISQAPLPPQKVLLQQLVPPEDGSAGRDDPADP